VSKVKKRLIYLFFCGLLLAGIIHIIIILLIPYFGSKDAAKQISRQLVSQKFYYINDGKSLGISNTDPFLKLSVCKFDLEKSAIEIVGPDTGTFWSASVFDERGRVIYSLNDRTAIQNRLKMVIVNPIQMADIRQLQPEEIESSILVESRAERGFVLLRALVPDQSWESQSLDFLKRAECIPYVTNSAVTPEG
jgi:uncharacterized membrane protein